MEHEDLVEALEGRLGSRKSANDALDALRVPPWRTSPPAGGRVARPGFGLFDSAPSLGRRIVRDTFGSYT